VLSLLATDRTPACARLQSWPSGDERSQSENDRAKGNAGRAVDRNGYAFHWPNTAPKRFFLRAARYRDQPHCADSRKAIAITLLVLEVSVLWRYAVSERLIRSDIADSDVRLLTKRLAPGLAGYVVVIVLGLFLPVLAVLGYLVLALYIIVPLGALRRRPHVAS
jgi:hypothetical protein